jgi:YhcH/YjgK/YiaL family protein
MEKMILGNNGAGGRRNSLRAMGAGFGLTMLPIAATGKDSLLVQGDLKSWQTHAELRRLAVAFRFLERSDLAQLALGKHVIDPKAYAIIDKSKSQPPEKVEFESHRKYIDVHYMISGQVTTGFAPAETLKVITPYQTSDDATSYAVPANYVKVKLYPGHFAVFFPGGGHMPNCHLDGPHELHKVVVKVEHDYGLQA